MPALVENWRDGRIVPKPIDRSHDTENSAMSNGKLRRLESLINRLAAVLCSRKLPAPRRLESAQDVLELLQEQVEAIRAEATADAVEKARAIGYVVGVAFKALELGTLTDRLEKLEAAKARAEKQAAPTEPRNGEPLC
jgi:hypothetical protein